MKTAGDILSALFDERFMKKAQSYSKFFDSWKDITAKNGITAAADHSRIKDLDRGILLIETDHPGWKQILQTKQTKLLNDFRTRFPELDISGISLMLGSAKPQEETPVSTAAAEKTAATEKPFAAEPENTAVIEEPAPKGLDAIKDEELKEILKNLGQNIAAGEKKHC
jgi:hypothetical protein